MVDHMGYAPRGGLAHKMKPCGAWLCSAPLARFQEDILKILRFVRIRMIPRFL